MTNKKNLNDQDIAIARKRIHELLHDILKYEALSTTENSFEFCSLFIDNFEEEFIDQLYTLDDIFNNKDEYKKKLGKNINKRLESILNYKQKSQKNSTKIALLAFQLNHLFDHYLKSVKMVNNNLIKNVNQKRSRKTKKTASFQENKKLIIIKNSSGELKKIEHKEFSKDNFEETKLQIFQFIFKIIPPEITYSSQKEITKDKYLQFVYSMKSEELPTTQEAFCNLISKKIFSIYNDSKNTYLEFVKIRDAEQKGFDARAFEFKNEVIISSISREKY